MCVHTDQKDYPTVHEIAVYRNGNFLKIYEVVGEMNCCCAKQIALMKARQDHYTGNLEARIDCEE